METLPGSDREQRLSEQVSEFPTQGPDAVSVTGQRSQEFVETCVFKKVQIKCAARRVCVCGGGRMWGRMGGGSGDSCSDKMVVMGSSQRV